MAKLSGSPKPTVKDRQTKKTARKDEVANRPYSIFLDWMSEQAESGVRFQTMDDALAAFKQR